MIPQPFDYIAPKSVDEAVALLDSREEGAKILAGGQSLIPLLKLRLAAPTLLVDISRVPGLAYVRESGGFLMLGALTRIAEVKSSDLVRTKYPIIHEASAVIADSLVRNMGTVGGNISHGDPANDLPAVMLALGGEFVAIGPAGERSIRAEDFFRDTFTVALEHNEVLTEVRVPTPPSRSGGAYLKFEQKVGDFATAAVAVQLALNSRGECETLGIGLTAVGPTAIKARRAEESMIGRKPTDKRAIGEVAKLAAEESDPASDIRGGAEYKMELIERLVKRGLVKARRRAIGRSAR